MARRVDVTVVGAGPVGFLVALGLARSGIEVRLLEAVPSINESPRAAVDFPTTSGILDRLGLLEEACAIGLKSHEFCDHMPEHGTRIPVDTTAGLSADEPYPYNLHFGQHLLAHLVMRHLQKLPNVQVLFNHRVTGLSQDSDGVTVAAETAAGPQQFRSSWIVGADPRDFPDRRAA